MAAANMGGMCLADIRGVDTSTNIQALLDYVSTNYGTCALDHVEPLCGGDPTKLTLTLRFKSQKPAAKLLLQHDDDELMGSQVSISLRASGSVTSSVKAPARDMAVASGSVTSNVKAPARDMPVASGSVTSNVKAPARDMSVASGAITSSAKAPARGMPGASASITSSENPPARDMPNVHETQFADARAMSQTLNVIPMPADDSGHVRSNKGSAPGPPVMPYAGTAHLPTYTNTSHVRAPWEFGLSSNQTTQPNASVLQQHGMLGIPSNIQEQDEPSIFEPKVHVGSVSFQQDGIDTVPQQPSFGIYKQQQEDKVPSIVQRPIYDSGQQTAYDIGQWQLGVVRKFEYGHDMVQQNLTEFSREQQEIPGFHQQEPQASSLKQRSIPESVQQHMPGILKKSDHGVVQQQQQHEGGVLHIAEERSVKAVYVVPPPPVPPPTITVPPPILSVPPPILSMPPPPLAVPPVKSGDMAWFPNAQPSVPQQGVAVTTSSVTEAAGASGHVAKGARIDSQPHQDLQMLPMQPPLHNTDVTSCNIVKQVPSDGTVGPSTSARVDTYKMDWCATVVNLKQNNGALKNIIVRLYTIPHICSDSYFGINVAGVDPKNGYHRIASITPGYSAHQCNVIPGGFIIAINGQVMCRFTTETVKSKIHWSCGGKLKLLLCYDTCSLENPSYKEEYARLQVGKESYIDFMPLRGLGINYLPPQLIYWKKCEATKNLKTPVGRVDKLLKACKYHKSGARSVVLVMFDPKHLNSPLDRAVSGVLQGELSSMEAALKYIVPVKQIKSKIAAEVNRTVTILKKWNLSVLLPYRFTNLLNLLTVSNLCMLSQQESSMADHQQASSSGTPIKTCSSQCATKNCPRDGEFDFRWAFGTVHIPKLVYEDGTEGEYSHNIPDKFNYHLKECQKSGKAAMIVKLPDSRDIKRAIRQVFLGMLSPEGASVKFSIDMGLLVNLIRKMIDRNEKLLHMWGLPQLVPYICKGPTDAVGEKIENNQVSQRIQPDIDTTNTIQLIPGNPPHLASSPHNNLEATVEVNFMRLRATQPYKLPRLVPYQELKTREESDAELRPVLKRFAEHGDAVLMVADSDSTNDAVGAAGVVPGEAVWGGVLGVLTGQHTSMQAALALHLPHDVIVDRVMQVIRRSIDLIKRCGGNRKLYPYTHDTLLFMYPHNSSMPRITIPPADPTAANTDVIDFTSLLTSNRSRIPKLVLFHEVACSSNIPPELFQDLSRNESALLYTQQDAQCFSYVDPKGITTDAASQLWEATTRILLGELTSREAQIAYNITANVIWAKINYLIQRNAVCLRSFDMKVRLPYTYDTLAFLKSFNENKAKLSIGRFILDNVPHMKGSCVKDALGRNTQWIDFTRLQGTSRIPKWYLFNPDAAKCCRDFVPPSVLHELESCRAAGESLLMYTTKDIERSIENTSNDELPPGRLWEAVVSILQGQASSEHVAAEYGILNISALEATVKRVINRNAGWLQQWNRGELLPYSLETLKFMDSPALPTQVQQNNSTKNKSGAGRHLQQKNYKSKSRAERWRLACIAKRRQLR